MFFQPARKTSDVNLAYGGLIIQDASDVNSAFYRRFCSMVEYFAQGNLHLFIYPSPYLYGFGRPKAVEELIRTQGLTNVHPCEALEEDRWVQEISRHDYGVCIPDDARPCVYPYILPFKVIAYLRAGLPIVVPEDHTFLADLVRNNGIGVVYGYDGVNRMADLLNGQDVDQLKRNVLRFREQFRTDRAARKVLDLYNGALGPRRAVNAGPPSAAVDDFQDDQPAPSWSLLLKKLSRSGFIGADEYNRLLSQEIGRTLSGAGLQHVVGKCSGWFSAYKDFRCGSRLVELIAGLQGAPYWLYLDDSVAPNVLAHLTQNLTDGAIARPAGFIVGPGKDALKLQLAPYRVVSLGDDVPEGHTIVGVSGDRFPANGRTVVVNDYLERFIDSRRLRAVQEALCPHDDRPIVLYPLYREIHTLSMMAQFVRQKKEQLRSICLCAHSLLVDHFDTVLSEPFFYLWPLIFRIVDPALVHLNVGWGIQALALSPFIPDRRRAVVDFYEVLSFLPDAYFEKTHSTAEQVRFGEEHFVRNYDHVIHLCSDEISARLREKYHHEGSIVSVTEYLQEPLYCKPPRNDGEIRLVYGGCILASTNPNDLYYRAFMTVVPYYIRGNLRLYIYNSPYVHGIVENDPLKEIIRAHGLTNIHACMPLRLEDFVREISGYDYGITLLRARDMNATEYNYFMATKFLTYLQAGLPVVVYASNRFMAGLVERYGIGVILDDCDLESIPEVLTRADLSALKSNVVKFREEFSIEKGGPKVLRMYHEILRKTQDRPQCMVPAVKALPAAPHAPKEAVFDEMIEVMACKENRLYYRDQSARTMSSLAALARRFDPSVIVELGTLGGLSLRTWIASTERARIHAVDLSFQTLRETLEFLPADLSRVNLLEQDILKTDFARLWTPRDKVIFFVDAHDLPNVPIMAHVLATALPSLPDGSVVVVDDLWFSEERLTQDNAGRFLENHVLNEIDELQCFQGYFAPYHEGGSFMGFSEVGPLLKFVNEHGITLIHDRGAKHAFFVWKKTCLERRQAVVEGSDESDGAYGSVSYNPLESMPVCDLHSEAMRRIATLYRQRDVRGAAEALSKVLAQDPRDRGLSYGLAVCLARGGMLSQARDILVRNLNDSCHPRYRRLYADLVRRTGAPEPHSTGRPQPPSKPSGITIFAMPKAFRGRTATIQKNAIRSWARLDPAPEIILFGDEPGIREMAEEVGARHIPEVGRNEFGTPLVNRLFQDAQDHATHEVLAYVNADMILFQDFTQAAQRVQTRLASFLLIGQRWDVSILDEIDFRQPTWRESLLRQFQEHAMLHAECGLDYFVFRKGLWPQIPVFAIGRTAWDNWLVMDPHKRDVPVIDATEFITVIHQDHDYGHAAGGRHEVWNGMEAARNRALAGPADHTGLTTGATWLLRKDGSLAETPMRRPLYITAAYRERRSAWLLRQARRLLDAGASELAACKCEETIACLDGWLGLKRLGCTSSESVNHADIAGRYVTSCTLLAQCCMQMGCHEQVVAAYTRLLENPIVQIPATRRDEIVQVRDRLACRLEARTQPENPPARQVRKEVGSMSGSPLGSVSSVAQDASSLIGSSAPAGRRPKVTVITTCHNGERYLKECVDSILDQTMTDWELFLVDDGSTDNTGRMIEDYARRDARIRPCHFPDSRGPYVRRNFAIRRAASDFIVIQDADDIMSPTKLERLHSEITRNDCLGMVGSFPRMFLEEFRGLEYTEPGDLPTDHDTIAASCTVWRATISHGTAIIRKSLFDTIGLYDENPFAADAFWSAKLALYGHVVAPVKMANVPEYLTLIRVHPGSQTQTLPVFDPRGRRARYRRYCECKLRRIWEKWRRQPQFDVATELRDCTCSDFLTRFKAEILQWESEVLPVHLVNDLLTGALSSFRGKAYVSCMMILNGLEVMQPDIARRVTGFDLLRGTALHASGLPERGLTYLQREIENHDSFVARRFLDDSREQGALMDVHRWCAENASSLELRLAGEERERIRVAMA